MNGFADICSILGLLISIATLLVSWNVKSSIKNAKRHVYFNSQIEEYISTIGKHQQDLYMAYTRHDWTQVIEIASEIKAFLETIEETKSKAFQSDIAQYIAYCKFIINGHFVNKKSNTPWYKCSPKEYTRQDVYTFYTNICKISRLLKFEKSQL